MDGVPLDALVTRMLARSPFDYRVAAGDAEGEGEQARQDLAAAIETLGTRAARFVERRAEAEAARPAGQDG